MFQNTEEVWASEGMGWSNDTFQLGHDVGNPLPAGPDGDPRHQGEQKLKTENLSFRFLSETSLDLIILWECDIQSFSRKNLEYSKIFKAVASFEAQDTSKSSTVVTFHNLGRVLGFETKNCFNKISTILSIYIRVCLPKVPNKHVYEFCTIWFLLSHLQIPYPSYPLDEHWIVSN